MKNTFTSMEKSIFLYRMLLVFYVLFFCSFFPYPYATKGNDLDSLKKYKQWEITNLSDTLKSLNSTYFTFMNENSMNASYIELSAGDMYKKSAIKDEIYYVHSGNALMNNNIDLSDGTVIHIKSGSEILIDNVSKTIQLILIDINSPSDLSLTQEWKKYDKSFIEATRNFKKNIWNPFIKSENVIFGMYMLPKELDGDNRLVHTWQELNIVRSGESEFILDDGKISICKGSIFFVDKGNGHYFDKIKRNLDVLILWE